MKEKIIVLFYKLRFTLRLLTVQTAVVIGAVLLLTLSGIVVIAGPDRDDDKNKIVPVNAKTPEQIKNTYETPNKIRLSEIDKEYELLVYDKLSKEGEKPVKFEIKEDEDGKYVELFPGLYKVVFTNPDYEPYIEEIVVKADKVLSFEPIFEESEDDEAGIAENPDDISIPTPEINVPIVDDGNDYPIVTKPLSTPTQLPIKPKPNYDLVYYDSVFGSTYHFNTDTEYVFEFESDGDDIDKDDTFPFKPYIRVSEFQNKEKISEKFFQIDDQLKINGDNQSIYITYKFNKAGRSTMTVELVTGLDEENYDDNWISFTINVYDKNPIPIPTLNPTPNPTKVPTPTQTAAPTPTPTPKPTPSPTPIPIPTPWIQTGVMTKDEIAQFVTVFPQNQQTLNHNGACMFKYTHPNLHDLTLYLTQVNTKLKDKLLVSTNGEFSFDCNYFEVGSVDYLLEITLENGHSYPILNQRIYLQ
ncbi:hypothetical protein KBD45_07140 [Candidatus Dojkabacteria bacterium]|nr:hypothetical protein [Candidatus Dojkabacteria bacterium]